MGDLPNQMEATMAYAHAYRCSGCVPEIVVEVDLNGFATVDVYHTDVCTVDPTEDANAASRAVAERFGAPVFLMAEEVRD